MNKMNQSWLRLEKQGGELGTVQDLVWEWGWMMQEVVTTACFHVVVDL